MYWLKIPVLKLSQNRYRKDELLPAKSMQTDTQKYRRVNGSDNQAMQTEKRISRS
ncbi:MAG: hypothetical protein GX267_18275 [Fibrobacter sp.]|nr:hypothetical protein [Fibrobacter sp.]